MKMQKLTRWITFLMVVCMLLAGTTAAAEATEPVVVTITGPDSSQSYTSGTYFKTISITKGGTYEVSSSDPDAEAMFSISIEAPGEEVVLRLNGVNLHSLGSSFPGSDCIRCVRASKITIETAAGTVNRITGSKSGSGIEILDSCGDVVLSGSGSMIVTGSGASANPGSYGSAVYHSPAIHKGTGSNYLIIESGTVEAYGVAGYAAGIGGGSTIVTGSYGGSGYTEGENTANIKITGGNIIARSFYQVTSVAGRSFGMGIGNGVGAKAKDNSNIIIAPAEGTTITARIKNALLVDLWKNPAARVYEENTSVDVTADIISAHFETNSVVEEKIVTYTISAAADPADGGAVAGGGEYDAGETVTLTATANTGYRFIGWYEGITMVSSEENYTFEVEADRELTAVFETLPPENALLITRQPADQDVMEGESASFSVEAVGTDPLTYQWQIDRQDGNGFVDVSCTTQEFELSGIALEYDGFLFRCIVTDAAGHQAVSDAAELNVSARPAQEVNTLKITKHPVDQQVTEGGSAVFTVEAEGTEPLTYQWQVNRQDGNGFVELTCTSNRLTITGAMLKEHGFTFRCMVADADGNRAVSKAAVLRVLKENVEPAPAVPGTGDDTPLGLLVMLSGLSGFIILWMNKRVRKMHR